MSGEVIGIINGVGKGFLESIVASIDALSALGGVIIGAGLTFLSSWIMFRFQKRHDEKKIKIEKSLELLYNLDKISKEFLSESMYGTHKYETANLHEYNRPFLEGILDLILRSEILYFYIFSKKLEFSKMREIAASFFRHREGIEELNDGELTYLGEDAYDEIIKIKSELEKFIR